ncbi:MAG: transcription antitermination factor NusB [Planctomycetes bacterium]|nr:transcription antitermination factor NusB [Planctomycetota bacterium]
MGARTRAREVALQALFCRDVLPDRGWQHAEQTVRESEVPPEVREFARELVDGVHRRVDEIDGMLVGATENWSLERLAAVDRNILRLAVYELIERDDIPARVTINEAIELGKRFSTAQSGGFVNGVLDRIRKDLGLPAVELDAPLDEDAARPLDLGDAPLGGSEA